VVLHMVADLATTFTVQQLEVHKSGYWRPFEIEKGIVGRYFFPIRSLLHYPPDKRAVVPG